MTSTLRLTTTSRHPVEELFDVSLSIDEHLESMSASQETAIAGVTRGSIGLGETVTWRARHFGVWFTMTSRIVELDRPHMFVDEQVTGPFRIFRHEHVFESTGTGSRMTDIVAVASPVFGRLAERAVLVPYLTRLLRERNHHLVKVLDERYP